MQWTADSTHLRRGFIVALLVALGCGPRVGAVADSLPQDSALRAGFLIVDGVYNTELMAPWDVFQHTAHHSAPHPGIEVFTIAAEERPITTAEGLTIVPDYTFDTAPKLDILVVPSAEQSRDDNRRDDRLIAWVGQAGRDARYIVSLCWGAFILAEAGLLDGHACTTFPGDYPTFAEAFPSLDLKVNASFVHDGNVLTSQGGTRSYEVAMYLVDLLFGERVAKGVGSGLLIEWPWTEGNRPAYVTQTGPEPSETQAIPDRP